MGIRFHCPNCDKKLNVKAFLAGKRGICPYCDSGLDIPLESEIPNGKAATTQSVEVRTVARQAEGSSEPSINHSSLADTAVADEIVADRRESVDPIEEAPDAVWYVRPPSGGQFGPAKGDVMRKWLAEGRVSPEALVWREGWEDWLTAAPVFPSLQASSSSSSAPPPPPAASETPEPAAAPKPVASPTAVATPAPRTVAADPELGAATETKSTSQAYAKRRSNLPALIAVVALVIVSIMLLIGLVLALNGTFQ